MKDCWSKLTLEQRLKRLPPFLCLALTRVTDNGNMRRPTREELAERSGLHYMQVARLSRRVSWDNCNVDVAVKFLNGCGIDLCHPRQVALRMREMAKLRQPFYHLTSIQYKKFCRNMEKYKATMKSAPAPEPGPQSLRSTPAHQ